MFERGAYMKLTTVIVIYNMEIEKTKTIESLKNNKLFFECENMDSQVIIYDNSNSPQDCPQIFKNQVYIHDERNIGIVTAYNKAWEIASNKKNDWLLLLDQDTEITEDYLKRTIAALSNNQQEENIVAIVPTVYSNEKVVSPVFLDSLRPLKNTLPSKGLQEKKVMAINSGAVIRVSFLNEINGFNKEFPLDYLDHWLFHTIYEKNRKIFLSDAKLNHDLSVMNYNTISLGRYKSIVDSEVRYYNKYLPDKKIQFKKHLFLRMMKQAISVKNKRIFLYTAKQIFK